MIQGGLTSCTKDNTIYDTVTIIEKDTIIIKDTAVSEDILTAHPWKLEELRGVNEGSIVYYLRGGSSNTDDFTNEYYVFNSNHSGFEMDNGGVSHNTENWQFSNPEKTKLTFTYYVSQTNTIVVTWDNLRYKNSKLYYDEYYSNPYIGKDFHGQGIRIAK